MTFGKHSKRASRASEPQGSSALLSVNQAADFLGVHPRTVYEYVYTKRLAVKRLGRLIRIETAALQEMLR